MYVALRLPSLQKTDSIGHFNDAIITAQDAFLVLLDGDSKKNMFLYHFVRALRLRYERLGDIEDLDAVNLMMEEIVDTTLETDPDYAFFLNSLGNSLHVRISKGDTTVINRLIEVLEKTIQFMQSGHNHGLWTANLAGAYIVRYRHEHALNDLEMAISTIQTALPLVDEKSGCLGNLGYCYDLRYQTTRSRRDLEASIKVYSEAYELAKGSNMDRITLRNNTVAGRPGSSSRSRKSHVKLDP
jgi:tetratricopeptide (TPR) repeat protein